MTDQDVCTVTIRNHDAERNQVYSGNFSGVVTDTLLLFSRITAMQLSRATEYFPPGNDWPAPVFIDTRVSHAIREMASCFLSGKPRGGRGVKQDRRKS